MNPFIRFGCHVSSTWLCSSASSALAFAPWLAAADALTHAAAPQGTITEAFT